LADGDGSEGDGGRLGVGRAGGLPHLHISFGNDVFGKGAVFWLDEIRPVDDAADLVALAPLLGDGFPDVLNHPRVVATHQRAVHGSSVRDVFPVGGIQRHGVRFDEHVVIPQRGQRSVVHQLRSIAHDHDRAHGRMPGECRRDGSVRGA
jgi:hypothetical protein